MRLMKADERRQQHLQLISERAFVVTPTGGSAEAPQVGGQESGEKRREVRRVVRNDER